MFFKWYKNEGVDDCCLYGYLLICIDDCCLIVMSVDDYLYRYLLMCIDVYNLEGDECG